MYQYDLSGQDGMPLAGRLTAYGTRYTPGEIVDVIADRRARLDPALASDLEGEREVGIVAAGLLTLAALLSIPIGSRGPMEQTDLRFSRYRARH